MMTMTTMRSLDLLFDVSVWLLLLPLSLMFVNDDQVVDVGIAAAGVDVVEEPMDIDAADDVENADGAYFAVSFF